MKILIILLSISYSQYVCADVNEREYMDSITLFKEKISPWLDEKYQKKLQILGIWEDDRLGANPYYPNKNTWGLRITGGLARNTNFLHKDMIIFVLCHELGHHIYGLGAEGLSDYFASKCMKLVLNISDHDSALTQWNQLYNLEEIVKFQCEKTYMDKEAQLCVRIQYSNIKIQQFRQETWMEYYPNIDFPSLKFDLESKFYARDINLATTCRLNEVFFSALGRKSLDCKM